MKDSTKHTMIYVFELGQSVAIRVERERSKVAHSKDILMAGL